jgi:hypothetical protein
MEAEESGTDTSGPLDSLALFTTRKCPNGEAEGHGRVATCPKPAGEKQGRQLLSQKLVVSPGQDVTGGLKGRITRGLQA